MINKVSGVILAGGKSSRIGEDKAFLLLEGKPLIEIMLDKLKTLFKSLLIITNKPQVYKKYGIKTYKDIIAEHGPLGGIYTALTKSRSAHSFIVACDMPFLNPDFVRYMLRKIDGFDVVIPRYRGQLEPLCTVYSKNCIPSIENEISKKNLKIRSFFPNVKVKVISEAEILKFDSEGKLFVNINTLPDYRKITSK
jgi:molybdopterin-guanine dinucleotide biosynthesis protein A